ncbi:MAG: hypothetical protein IT373_38335 [Polyangiaceae bacterium]|nr:hypothetical protein [Polyangiaceae bacterium]
MSTRSAMGEIPAQAVAMLAIVGTFALGCGGGDRSAAPSATAPRTSASAVAPASASVAPSARATPGEATSVATGAPTAAPSVAGSASSARPAPVPRCPALGSKALVKLATLPAPAEAMEMVLSGSSLFLLAAEDQARTVVFEVKLDEPFEASKALTKVGTHTGATWPASLVPTEGDLFFTRGSTVVRLAKAGGEATVVADALAPRIAAVGSSLYGVGCGEAGQAHLLRAPLAGGPVETVATWPVGETKNSDAACRYPGLFVEGDRAYVAEPESRRLLRIPLDGRGGAETVASDLALPLGLFRAGSDLVVPATDLVLRVPLGGGEPARIAAPVVPASPFAWNARELFWLQRQTVHNLNGALLYRLGHAAGAAKQFDSFGAPVVEALAADDACLYVLRHDPPRRGAVVYAMPIPIPASDG